LEAAERIPFSKKKRCDLSAEREVFGRKGLRTLVSTFVLLLKNCIDSHHFFSPSRRLNDTCKLLMGAYFEDNSPIAAVGFLIIVIIFLCCGIAALLDSFCGIDLRPRVSSENQGSYIIITCIGGWVMFVTGGLIQQFIIDKEKVR